MSICPGVEWKGSESSQCWLQLDLSCSQEHPCICPGARAHQVLGCLLPRKKHRPKATSEEERVYWLVAYRPSWRAAKTLTPGSNLEKALEQRPQWSALSWLVLHGLLRLVCYMTQDHLPQDSSTVSIVCVELTQTNQLTLLSVFCFCFFDSVNSPIGTYTCTRV